MKQITFTLVITVSLLLSACKNIEKMVDKGDYDGAISYAVKKLEGKKNKETKYVRALERAFVKVNNRDNKQISKLLSTNNIDKYDKVYDIYTNMDRRQNKVLRLDPLVSKDGYVAEFNVENYNVLINEASSQSLESHYKEANRLLQVGRTSDKYAAREAYKELGYLERYTNRYKDSDALYVEAYNLGVDHVSVSVYLNDLYPMGHLLENKLYDLDITSLNDFWTQFHIGDNLNIPFDFTATMEVNHIDPGFEREHYNSYEESKEIENGKKPVKDLKGNVVKDTLGNIVYTKSYKRVTAEITELRREKFARLTGKTVVYDNRNKSLVKSIPLDISHQFEDYSASYRGDERALSSNTKQKLKNSCSMFPSDFDMVLEMANDFRNTAYNILRRDLR